MNQKKGGYEGPRSLEVRLKTAAKRTTSSQKWLSRQLNDPYVLKARQDGYRSRAAYKLLEIDDRYKVLKTGQRIVDLGAAPGGWSQVAASRIGRTKGQGRMIGIDLLDIEPIEGVEFTVMDFHDVDAPERLKTLLSGPADVVLSDLAGNTTGHRPTDHLRIIGLVERAAEFACQVLAPGGSFLSKVLQGGTEQILLAQLKEAFATVRHVKPSASRSDSAELYMLATGFRG